MNPRADQSARTAPGRRFRPRRRFESWLGRRLSALLDRQPPTRRLDGTVQVGRDVELFGRVSWEGENRVNRGSVLLGGVEIGLATTFGSYCLVQGPAVIGRYGQIGGDVAIIARTHPLNTMSHYTGHQLFSGRRKDLEPPRQVTVGHDVWIGHGATLLPGVTVGNGAVIGANAMVNADVEPYAIVGGTPARVLRFRFGPAVIDALERFAWWELTPDELLPYEDLMALDVTLDEEAALAALEAALATRGD